MWQICSSPFKCIPSSVFPSSLWTETFIEVCYLYSLTQAWPLISGEYFNILITVQNKAFTQDRKVKFWENSERVLCLKLLSCSANHQHSVVCQHCSSHYRLTQIWVFFGARCLLEKSQWVRSVFQVTFRKQRIQSLKNCKCDCFNKI